MSFQCATQGNRVEAKVYGQVTEADLTEVWDQFSDGPANVVLDFSKMTSFPTFLGLVRASEHLTKSSSTRFAFIAGSLVTYGYARMLAAAFDLEGYNIFKSASEAVNWLSTLS